MITRPTAVLATLALSLGVPSAASAVSLTGAGVQIDFTDYAGQGFSPTPAPGQLDSDDWAVEGLSTGDLLFGGTAIGGDFARGLSTGGVPQGGLYAFDVSGGGVGPQIAFGWQPSGGDLTPGAFMLAVTNDTLLPLSALRIEWTVWSLNNGNRSTEVSLSISEDGLLFTPLPGTSLVSPAAADTPAQWADQSTFTTVVGLSVPVGDVMYVRWQTDDAGGMGGRDELGLDDLSLEVAAQCGDGTVDTGEACDEGVVDPADPNYRPGCGGVCTFFCGDGQLDPPEECDDGNNDDGDGCDAACTLEPGNPGTSTGTIADTGSSTAADSESFTETGEPGDVGSDGPATDSSSGAPPPAGGSGVGPGPDPDPTTVAMTASSSFTGFDHTAGPLDDDGCFCRPRTGGSGVAGSLGIFMLLMLRRRRRQ